MRLMIWTMLSCFTSVATFAGDNACPSIGNANTRPTFDAALLKEGRFTYRTTLRGESLGEMVIEVRRAGEDFKISMNAPAIAQSWRASVRKSFAPISASLNMRRKAGPYEMKLEYAGARVTGEENDAGDTRPVKARVKGVVIDQRVDWASMMAIVRPAEGSLAMRVFDPSTGLSPMLGKIVGVQGESLRFDYTICKREHLEAYTVHATRDTPRYMLREDMPNGLVSELIRIEP